MEVIFIKDLKGQGKKGDVKVVKDGYGKNYLIKNGYAVMASSGNLKHLETENVKKDIQEKALIQECEETKKKIEKLTLQFKVKTGFQDQVFGSVSTKQIIQELKKSGFNLDKKQVLIDTPITSLGFHYIDLCLHKQVTAKLKIEVIKES